MSSVGATNGDADHGEVKMSRLQKQKLKRAVRKKKKQQAKKEKSDINHDENNTDNKKEVDVEYVMSNPLEMLETEDPYYQEFAQIFNNFGKSKKTEVKVVEGQEEAPEQPAANPQEVKKEAEDEKSEDDKPKLSRRKKREARRVNIALLKTIVKKPELVEIQDCSSADPFLLVHLKGYRNAVPVPRHWLQKRKYLQGKRGIEKPPFELPHFIKATGIMDARGSMLEKDAESKLKSKTRERLQPKIGRLDLDYNVMRDAFLRHQTKPILTNFGELYYEGKEFEVKLKEKRPGVLSEELKAALGIRDGQPPPWLYNMQRFGPPPSYPKLRIPGVNAPLPPGASWGYHPGGWGKAPVDDYGNPLWGNIQVEDDKEFTTPPDPFSLVQNIPRGQLWGLLGVEEELPEEEEGSVSENQEGAKPEGQIPEDVSGLESVPGIETPAQMELRKNRGREEDDTEMLEEPKQLYQVLPQKQASATGSGMTAHTYDVRASKLDLMKSQRTAEVEVALDPSDLELPEEELQKKYNKVLAEQEKSKQPTRADVSDVIEENTKKRKGAPKESKKTKKQKEFKF
jgi:splicing factor 3B subunit 2